VGFVYRIRVTTKAKEEIKEKLHFSIRGEEALMAKRISQRRGVLGGMKWKKESKYLKQRRKGAMREKSFVFSDSKSGA